MSFFRKTEPPILTDVIVETHFGPRLFKARTSVVSAGMLKLLDGDYLVACFAPGSWCAVYPKQEENADA